MNDQVHDVLIAYAPYIAGIISAAIAYLSYQESKRKTKHDQLADLADRYTKDNDRLRRENDHLRKEIAKLKEDE
jgi:cell division protein FtsB